jgi:hypothetical protein
MISIHFFLIGETPKRFGPFTYDIPVAHCEGDPVPREIGVGFILGLFGVSIGREITT